MSEIKSATEAELRGVIAMPQFKTVQEELGWLRWQLLQLQELVAFQTNRLRLRQDLWDARAELDLLHSARSESLSEENTQLQREVAVLSAKLARSRGDARSTMTAEEHAAFPKGRWT